MPYALENLELSQMTHLGGALRALGAGDGSLEEVAQQATALLHASLKTADLAQPACVLTRFFHTLDFADLTPELKAFGLSLMPDQDIRPDTPCLTLLGTAGEHPDWRDRRRSKGHQTIPLPSAEVIRAIPMISQLLSQLGLDVPTLLGPSPDLVLEMKEHSYNVFWVPEALGSPHIPAQDAFVRPFGVKSVLGFGGMLPSRHVYAVLMFTRVAIPREVADIFRVAAMNLKVALLPFVDGPYFAPETTRP